MTHQATKVYEKIFAIAWGDSFAIWIGLNA